MEKLFDILSFFYLEKIFSAIKYMIRLIKNSYFKRKLQAGKNFYVFSFRSLKGIENISIGDRFTAGKNLMLQAWKDYEEDMFEPSITIGDNVHLGDENHIGAINKIVIGNNLLTGSNVYITDHNHGQASTREELETSPIKRNLYSKGEVYIGDNVWLGNNVVVMPGVTIGSGAVVGANSVVTKDIPAYAVVAGVPARIIRKV